MNKEKAVKKEKEYAERRFGQLLERLNEIPENATEEEINDFIKFLDSKWRAFCDHLIYISPNGKDEFLKVAEEKAHKIIIVTEKE